MDPDNYFPFTGGLGNASTIFQQRDSYSFVDLVFIENEKDLSIEFPFILWYFLLFFFSLRFLSNFFFSDVFVFFFFLLCLSLMAYNFDLSPFRFNLTMHKKSKIEIHIHFWWEPSWLLWPATNHRWYAHANIFVFGNNVVYLIPIHICKLTYSINTSTMNVAKTNTAHLIPAISSGWPANGRIDSWNLFSTSVCRRGPSRWMLKHPHHPKVRSHHDDTIAARKWQRVSGIVAHTRVHRQRLTPFVDLTLRSRAPPRITQSASTVPHIPSFAMRMQWLHRSLISARSGILAASFCSHNTMNSIHHHQFCSSGSFDNIQYIHFLSASF